MKSIKLYLNYAGHCFASAKHVVKGDKDEMIKFHALFALLHHPWIKKTMLSKERNISPS